MAERRESKAARLEPSTAQSSPSGVVAAMSATLAGVLEAIGSLREDVVALVTKRAPDRVTKADLRTLHPRIEAMIRAFDGLIVGAGMVVDPGFLKDTTHWVDWRMADPKGFHALEVTLDASAVSNYDYTETPWFTLPRDGADKAVVGPYVDFGGTNAYIVTVTLPVVADGRFIGVVGADLSVDHIELVLRRLTRSLGMAAMVVTEGGRVVASSVPRQHPGMLVPGLDAALAAPARGRRRLQVIAFAPVPWRLVVFACADPRACTAASCGCELLR